MNKFTEAVIGIAAAFALDFLTVRVLTDMWAWFVVPLGAFALPYWHMAGLFIFTGVIFMNKDKLAKLAATSWKKDVSDRANLATYVLIVWGMGALVHTVMISGVMDGKL